MDSYQIGDRRPLASRSWKISEKIARWLARHGATPNAISVVGMICGILAGIMFALTAGAAYPWFFWIFGALFVQVRLLANLYDGMVAVLRQVASPVGELFNEVPDRVSDAATLIGFGYAAGSNPLLGFVATIFAIFLAYLRAQGKVAGAHQEFCGPMAKQQRMATVTFAALVCAIVPSAIDWQIPMLALWLIIAGCIITIVRRLQRIAATLHRR
jgi:phosphatidylglycerophosphate synthase